VENLGQLSISLVVKKNIKNDKSEVWLHHLDPHVVQSSVQVKNGSFPLDSYHPYQPLKMGIQGIDPSLAVGFYCHDKEDFVNFWNNSKKLMEGEAHPLWCFEPKAPEYRKQKKRLSIGEFEMVNVNNDD